MLDRIARTPMIEPIDAFETHPSSEALAAHVDGALSGDERERVLNHLAECRRCRRDVEAAETIVPSRVPARRRWTTRAVASISAIAAVALLVVRLRSPEADVESQMATRVSHPDVVAPIDVITPADGTALAGAPVRLVWRSVGRDASYDVTVQDSVGRPVQTLTTPDTMVTIADEAGLERGHAYYWSVDALRADGSSTRSRASRFVR
jgi:hypothetical protein